MNKYLFAISFCLSLFLQGKAQEIDSIISNLKRYNKYTPQENVYLDIDKWDGCAIGDTVRFKAHVIRTDSMKSTDLSGVLYVDLVSPNEKVVDSRKLKLTDGRADSYLVVDSLLASGFYSIYGYTRYQSNWKNGQIFHAILPVCYPDSLISNKTKKKNKGAGFINTDDFQISSKDKAKQLRASFYPEGCVFLNGYKSKIAVHATDGWFLPAKAKFYVRDSKNKVVSSCTLDKYGNGILEVTPSIDSYFYISAKEKYGKHKYSLPNIFKEGANIDFDNTKDDSLRVTVTLSPKYFAKRICTMVMSHGNVLFCDTLKWDNPTRRFCISKEYFERGVNELIIFSNNGTQLCQRRFFHGKMNSEEEQWALFESEITARNINLTKDAYKTLTPEEIDQILMVGEDSRYPWIEMAETGSREMSQPIEDDLMVFGKISLKGKKKNGVNNVPLEQTSLDNHKFALTLNQGKLIYKSNIVTDKNGYFGAYFKGLKGEWMLMAHNNKEVSKYNVLLFDLFSPRMKPNRICDLMPELFGKKKWVDPKPKIIPATFYDCDFSTKMAKATGRISDSFYKWLGNANTFLRHTKGIVSPVKVNIEPEATYNKYLDYNFLGTSSDDPRTVCIDGPSYKGRPIVWIIDGQYRMVTGMNKMITDFKVLRPCERHMPNYVDEVKNVYISEDPKAFHPYMRCSVLEKKKPVTIFINLHKNYIWNDSGLVTAPFKGLD